MSAAKEETPSASRSLIGRAWPLTGLGLAQLQTLSGSACWAIGGRFVF